MPMRLHKLCKTILRVKPKSLYWARLLSFFNPKHSRIGLQFIYFATLEIITGMYNPKAMQAR